MKKIKDFFSTLVRSFQLFNSFNGLKLSAALSYYTVFSLAPLLIVIISFAGIFFGQEAVQGKVYGQIRGLVGSDTAVQIQNIIKNIKNSHHGTLGSIIGFIFLVIGASGVFSEIQDSINYLWSVSSKAKKGISALVTTKLMSFSLLASMGFILLVSLIVNSIIDILSARLKIYFADYVIYLFYVINLVLILVVTSGIFAIIFKVLPNARIRWKDAVSGALFTSILFLLGKFLIGFYLGNSKIGLTYGTAASIVIIMLWVYYSSIILYFGAAYTKIQAGSNGFEIQSKDKKPRSGAIPKM